jgi:long-chain acyl-CoA synthetase
MLMRLIDDAAAVRPDHLALVHAEERITYAELAERIKRLAAALADRGIGAGDAVALLLGNTPDFVTSFFAVTGLGAAVAPLNPAFKQDELETCFAKCGVRLAIADERSAGTCRQIAESWSSPLDVVDDPGALIDASAPLELADRAPDEVFVYQFSSGSTGRPKRVARTHANMWAEAQSYTWLDAEDRVFCAVPLFHTYGMGCCLLTAVVSGATLVLLDEPHPFVLRRNHALELIERERATIFPGVPLNFRLLSEAPATADVSSLRLCFSAGTALPWPTFEAFARRFGKHVRQLYGSTETGTLTVNLDPDPVGTFASVGTPAEGVEVRIEDGEVAVRSPAMTAGYMDAKGADRLAFRDGWWYTGDVGRLDEGGRLILEGRKKLLIEVAGHKVDPVEVEDVVMAHPGVLEAVVVGVRGEVDGDERVKAVVVPSNGCAASEVVEFCRERLANFKVPQIVEFRDEIPKSPLGKVLRKYLV